MNSLMWVALNCALLFGAYGVTVWVRDYQPPPAWSAQAGEDGANKTDTRVQGRPADEGTAATAASPRFKLEDIDDLWKKDLFRPERTEEVAGENTDAQPQPPPQQAQMELIGIGKIGRKGEEKPVAIILDKTPVRRTYLINRLIQNPMLPGVRISNRRNPPPKKQHVYRVGSKVGATGYTVTKIDFNQVLLVRGDEQLTLKLEGDDEQSRRRREQAVASAKAREQADRARVVREQVAMRGNKAPKTTHGHPPAPPPPPVAAPNLPGVVHGTVPGRGPTPTSAMSREERLQRARLLRERILQQRLRKTN